MNNFKSLNALDKKMLKYINYKNGTFIEMGANDGVNQSNTYFYEKELNWFGVLIEPSKQYKTLVKTRSNKENFLLNEACCSFKNEGTDLDFYYSDLMTICDDPKNNLIPNAKSWSKNGEKFKKTGLALSNLLSKHNTPNHFNFFSLDVEGFEIEILNGIDFSKHSFDYILIEVKDIDKTTELLNRYNYKNIDLLSHHDYLFQNQKK